MANPFEAMPPISEAKPEKRKEEKEEGETMKQSFETREGEMFTVERLISPEDPRVEEVQKMLARRFGKKEVDPIEVMKESMTGRMETGEEVPRYLVCVAQDEKGKVVACATGAAVELVDKKHQVSETGAVLLDAYAVISPELQQKGVDTHLFAVRERAAFEDAESRGLKLVGYIVEDGGSDEKLYNRYGARRVYQFLGKWADQMGFSARERLEEVPYIAPPVDWNRRTGKPKAGAGSVPEHLMIKIFPDAPWVSGETLMGMVRGMFFYNNEREREYFASDTAYRAHIRLLRTMEREFKAALADMFARTRKEHRVATLEEQNLNLVTQKDREQGQNLGEAKFEEHQSEEDLERQPRRRSSYRSAGGPRSRMGESKKAALAAKSGGEREGITMAEKDFKNPEGYWTYEGTFRVELTEDAPMERRPANAFVLSGNTLEVPSGRIKQAMGGIQFFGYDKVGEEQPFHFAYKNIKAIRNGKGELIWLNDDYR